MITRENFDARFARINEIVGNIQIIGDEEKELIEFIVELEQRNRILEDTVVADRDELNSVIAKKDIEIKELKVYRDGYFYLKDKYESK